MNRGTVVLPTRILCLAAGGNRRRRTYTPVAIPPRQASLQNLDAKSQAFAAHETQASRLQFSPEGGDTELTLPLGDGHDSPLRCPRLYSLPAVLLENQVALIAGSGRGIGRAVAKLFAAECASVFLTARRAAELTARKSNSRVFSRLSWRAAVKPPAKSLTRRCSFAPPKPASSLAGPSTSPAAPLSSEAFGQRTISANPILGYGAGLCYAPRAYLKRKIHASS